MQVYEQKDIGEFFMTFLERLQEGIGENKSIARKLMKDDLIKELDTSNPTFDQYLKMSPEIAQPQEKNKCEDLIDLG